LKDEERRGNGKIKSAGRRKKKAREEILDDVAAPRHGAAQGKNGVRRRRHQERGKSGFSVVSSPHYNGGVQLDFNFYKAIVMSLWLFKQEPDCYSLSDLERDRTTLWDGVTNALARKNLRACKPGDRVFFYHTGKEKAVVGEMEIVGGPRTDSKSDDPKNVAVEVKLVRRLKRPVTLAEIKADKLLADWDLVLLPRLSVVPTSREQWQRVLALAANVVV